MKTRSRPWTLVMPAVLGSWLALAAVAPEARADAGPGCGGGEDERPPPQPPRPDSAVGFQLRQSEIRTAGGGLILAAGLASIWAVARRRGAGGRGRGGLD